MPEFWSGACWGLCVCLVLLAMGLATRLHHERIHPPTVWERLRLWWSCSPLLAVFGADDHEWVEVSDYRRRGIQCARCGVFIDTRPRPRCVDNAVPDTREAS